MKKSISYHYILHKLTKMTFKLKPQTHCTLYAKATNILYVNNIAKLKSFPCM